MRIAYIVLAHKNPRQVRQLVSRIAAPQVTIFVHVDRNTSPVVDAEFKRELHGVGDINWLGRRWSNWGSFGLVEATLEGIRYAAMSDADYAILLSGQDYPIKPCSALQDFLAASSGRSFIQYYELPSFEWPADGAKRYMQWHFNVSMKDSILRKRINWWLNKIFNALGPKRTFPPGLRPYGGSQWWCLHKDAIKHVVDFTNTHNRVMRFFRHVRIPDEMYFHTLLLNSEIRETIVNRSLTYLDWNGPPFPRILGHQDIGSLSSNAAFFARKFDLTMDPGILTSIDERLLMPGKRIR